MKATLQTPSARSTGSAVEHDWPARLSEPLWRIQGAPVSIERLGGMSGGRVERVRFDGTSVIVKRSRSPHEARFYEQVAPCLQAVGVPTPELLLALHEPDMHWLVIEDIPLPLPVSRADAWRPDPRIIAILARLHTATRADPPLLPPPPVQQWSDEATRAALDCLPTGDTARLAPMLSRLQRTTQQFSEPWCWISGDPNPRNWGVRDDGSPVLFDWEMFGPGRPATDLAIIIPGLGTPADYAALADAYASQWHAWGEPLPWTTIELAREIALAKVASVVLLLDAHVNGTADVSADLLAWLAEAVFAWIDSIAFDH